jgi:hypothetical protein
MAHDTTSRLGASETTEVKVVTVTTILLGIYLCGIIEVIPVDKEAKKPISTRKGT